MLEEPIGVRLSERSHGKLERLRESGYFDSLLDAYRFAVSFALAKGYDISNPDGIAAEGKRQTIFNVGSLDPKRELYTAVRLLVGNSENEPVYRIIERLAELGINELARRMEQGELNLLDILEESQAKLEEENSF